MNPLLLISFFTAGTNILQGFQQKEAMKSQAREAELQAREQEIQRRKELNKTLAMQNVMAAAQGRQLSSIQALQEADIAEAESGIKGMWTSTRAKQAELKSAGQMAMLGGFMSAGQSIGEGMYMSSKTSTPSKKTLLKD